MNMHGHPVQSIRQEKLFWVGFRYKEGQVVKKWVELVCQEEWILVIHSWVELDSSSWYHFKLLVVHLMFYKTLSLTLRYIHVTDPGFCTPVLLFRLKLHHSILSPRIHNTIIFSFPSSLQWWLFLFYMYSAVVFTQSFSCFYRWMDEREVVFNLSVKEREPRVGCLSPSDRVMHRTHLWLRDRPFGYISR